MNSPHSAATSGERVIWLGLVNYIGEFLPSCFDHTLPHCPPFDEAFAQGAQTSIERGLSQSDTHILVVSGQGRVALDYAMPLFANKLSVIDSLYTPRYMGEQGQRVRETRMIRLR